jgi:hypothetical protein
MRSPVSAIIRGGLAADLAPSISQSVSFCRSEMFMRTFAAQFPATSRRSKCFDPERTNLGGAPFRYSEGLAGMCGFKRDISQRVAVAPNQKYRKQPHAK